MATLFLLPFCLIKACNFSKITLDEESLGLRLERRRSFGATVLVDFFLVISAIKRPKDLDIHDLGWYFFIRC
ncbi:MAG: hypothetical protein H6Q73_1445 [Firmicutes bacterium]|nr:hypothetical protein [Bacillota bacterium]